MLSSSNKNDRVSSGRVSLNRMLGRPKSLQILRVKSERIGEIGNLLTEAMAIGNVASYLVDGKRITFSTEALV